MLRAEVNGVRIAYEDTGGDGSVVLFVHGLGGTAYSWRGQLTEAAARGYRALALDLRGAGRTGAPPGPYSAEQWAEDVVGLLDAAGVDRAALVGHSMGCMVAQRAARDLGERAWALALAGGTIRWPQAADGIFSARARLAREGRMDEIGDQVAAGALTEHARRERPVLHGLMLELIASSNPEGYALSAEAAGRTEMEGLDELGCPVLALVGSEDAVTTPAAAEEIAAAARQGRAETLAGLAHWAMLEDTAAFNGVLFGFLDGVRPA